MMHTQTFMVVLFISHWAELPCLHFYPHLSWKKIFADLLLFLPCWIQMKIKEVMRGSKKYIWDADPWDQPLDTLLFVNSPTTTNYPNLQSDFILLPTWNSTTKGSCELTL